MDLRLRVLLTSHVNLKRVMDEVYILLFSYNIEGKWQACLMLYLLPN